MRPGLALTCVFALACTGTLKGGGDGGVAEDARTSDTGRDASEDAGTDGAFDTGNVDVGVSDGGVGDTGVDADEGDAGVDAALGECPAPAPVHVEMWGEGDAWTVPSSGSARMDVFLTNESLLHYSRAVVEWDMRTNTTHGVFTQIMELRSVNAPMGITTPTRYVAVTTRNAVNEDTGEPTIWRDVIVQTTWGMCAEFIQSAPRYKMKSNHDYHVRFEWDAMGNESSVVLTEEDGTEIVMTGDAASSLVSFGRGLHLLFGVNDMHGDWDGGMRPPWGWVFSNLVVDLEPGGPLGTAAPSCDGADAPGCP